MSDVIEIIEVLADEATRAEAEGGWSFLILQRMAQCAKRVVDRRAEGDILEEAMDLSGNRMVTVRTKRGEEFLVNADGLISAASNLISDIDNEARGGWGLSADWYEQELRPMRAAIAKADAA